jgi:alanine racemase
MEDNLKYRTWLEISKSAINNNIAQYKKIIGNKILAPVIKSNAYGHGMIEVAKICEQNKDIDWLCVANADEALNLRKNGITKNILILSHIGQLAEQAIAQDISLIAYDLDTVNHLNSVGKKLGKKANLHIKIDTGLSRVGILPDEAVEFIKHIKNFEFINIEGIWTHFSEPASEDRAFTNLQASKFGNVIKELEKINIKIPFVHSGNSAGILTVNLECDNFYRPGVSFYGYWPSEYIKNFASKVYPNFKLTPCMTWKTNIFSIKNIPAGSFVGYMRTFQAQRDTKLAIIPVGYYDGYDRRFSNIGSVIINGQACKITGLICMNAIMIDVTDVQNVKIGDQVILVGPAPDVNINTMANATNMNPRDLTSKISLEIPRIIVE